MTGSPVQPGAALDAQGPNVKVPVTLRTPPSFRDTFLKQETHRGCSLCRPSARSDWRRVRARVSHRSRATAGSGGEDLGVHAIWVSGLKSSEISGVGHDPQGAPGPLSGLT